MNKEVQEKFENFQEQQAKMIIEVYNSMAAKVLRKYGKDVAVGFALGIDTVYFALTGKEMSVMMKEKK